MADIKTNIRDGAYVAIGAAALGVQHLTKKSEEVKAHLGDVSAKFEPMLKEASTKVSETITPIKEKINPVAQNFYETVSTHVIPTANDVAEKVSTNFGPATASVISRVKSGSSAAITSTKKIADEAKRRVS